MQMGKPILLVIAHPDDEALWCGGTLLKLKDNNWPVIIVSVTNGSNRTRRAEFEKACDAFGAEARMLDLPDGGLLRLADFGTELDAIVGNKALLCALTHARHGNERGHLQHRECYRIMRRWSHRRGIPFGTVSEGPVAARHDEIFTDVAPDVRRVALQPWRRRLHNIIASLPMQRNRRANLIGNFDAAVELEISIDADRKQQVLRVYRTQISGLQEYKTYHATREYIGFRDPRAADLFALALTGG